MPIQRKVRTLMINLLMSLAILVIFQGVGVSDGPGDALQKDAVRIKKPKGADQLRNLRAAAKIESLTVATETNGDWTYLYEVKNTGLAKLNLRNARFKAYQVLKNNRDSFIHEINTGQELLPGNVITGKYQWNRCSSALKFRLEVWYENKKLDSKTISLLPMRVQITRASIDSKKKTWFADIKNNTPNALKVTALAVVKGGLAERAGKAGAGCTQVIPAKGRAKFTGDLKAFNAGDPVEIQVVYDDPKNCGSSEGGLLGSKLIGSDGLAQPDVFVQGITWNRSTMTWVATVKNDRDTTVDVGIAGWVLENGVQGMTIWKNTKMFAHSTTQLTGDYSNFTVPPGTRLKVHVLLKPSNQKLHEKVIVLN